MTENAELYHLDEIKEMFDQSFLPKLQEFTDRGMKAKYPEKDVALYHTSIVLQFKAEDFPLTYEKLQDRIRIFVQPYSKEEIDEMAKNFAEKQAKNE